MAQKNSDRISSNIACCNIYLQIKSLFSRLAAKEREDTQSELIDDYENRESEIIQQTAFNNIMKIQRKKK